MPVADQVEQKSVIPNTAKLDAVITPGVGGTREPGAGLQNTQIIVRPENKVNPGVNVVQNANQSHLELVDKTTEHLQQAGYPHTPAQIHPQGEANQVLAKIKQANIGAEVIDHTHDLVTKGFQNLTTDVAGGKLSYHAQGVAGHNIVMEKAAKKAIFSGIVQKIRNVLHGKENK